MIDAEVENKIRESFDAQQFMKTIGARLATVDDGLVEIEIDWAQSLTQQNGFLHAGVVTSIVDSACGYAAFTKMPSDRDVLTVEFKTNLLAPAKPGQRYTAKGRVMKSGRTLTVCQGEVTGADGTVVALMQATMMAVERRGEPRMDIGKMLREVRSLPVR